MRFISDTALNTSAQLGMLARWQDYVGIAAMSSISATMPTIDIPINRHFSIGFRPTFGYGVESISMGMGATLNAHFRRWNFSLSLGGTSSYLAWHASASYNGWGLGYGRTYYEPTVMNGKSIQAQTVGTANIYIRGFELAFSNDALGDGKDRWRTNAVELSYGNFSIGSSIFTNNGNDESSKNLTTEEQQKYKNLNYGHNKVWPKGEVYIAPIWIGFRHHNYIYRMGYSHKSIQNMTQNAVHRHLTPTPLFKGYDHFYQGPFFSTSTVNPFSIW